MRMMPRSIVVAVPLGLIALIGAACGSVSSQLTPSGSTTTLMAGWEARFTLEWSAEPAPASARHIRGYVISQHGEHAVSMRLLAQALDSSGAVVGQRITAVPGGVAASQRAYFEIPRLPAAAHYRVTVWDYTLHQADGTMR